MAAIVRYRTKAIGLTTTGAMVVSLNRERKPLTARAECHRDCRRDADTTWQRAHKLAKVAKKNTNRS
jgi:hypothetical protein